MPKRKISVRSYKRRTKKGNKVQVKAHTRNIEVKHSKKMLGSKLSISSSELPWEEREDEDSDEQEEEFTENYAFGGYRKLDRRDFDYIKEQYPEFAEAVDSFYSACDEEDNLPDTPHDLPEEITRGDMEKIEEFLKKIKGKTVKQVIDMYPDFPKDYVSESYMDDDAIDSLVSGEIHFPIAMSNMDETACLLTDIIEVITIPDEEFEEDSDD